MIQRKLLEKPDLLALSANKPGFFPAFLESQSFNEKIGRYDILFAAPAYELVAYNQQQLDQLLTTIDTTPNKCAELSPFQWGWFVYFSYESSYLMESKLSHLVARTNEPLAIAIYCQGSVIYDHKKNTTWVYAENEVVAKKISYFIDNFNYEQHNSYEIGDVSEDSGEAFKLAVRKAKELINSGDIYQANLSRQYTCKALTDLRPVDVFSQLKLANPAPFAALLQCNQFAVASSSPERLLSIKNAVIETRPIAGTRPRGIDQSSDERLIKELIDTPKERAEHIMLIDLERNDIGKVCEIGSVIVDELMVIETYEHVHHIVSNVKGKLRSDVTVVDTIKALFPGGTITGCPKIRCMEIIHEIEQRDRSAYTGSLGYINHDGQVDLNILIRTVGIFNDEIKFNAGAGIVFDSVPESELLETRHKAKGMLNALTSL